MYTEIRHARYIMSRLLLDCLRLIDRVRVQSGQLTNDDTIIGMAVIVLEYEARAATSVSKLSFFTGVPRATVGRIVDRLVESGLVTRVGRKVAYAHPVDEIAIAAARKFWVLIDEAAQQVAHLERIAPQKVALLDKLLSQKTRQISKPLKMDNLVSETPKMGT
jgi:DNA-binding Lrp family transcriptional regulator